MNQIQLKNDLVGFIDIINRPMQNLPLIQKQLFCLILKEYQNEEVDKNIVEINRNTTIKNLHQLISNNNVRRFKLWTEDDSQFIGQSRLFFEDMKLIDAQWNLSAYFDLFFRKYDHLLAPRTSRNKKNASSFSANLGKCQFCKQKAISIIQPKQRRAADEETIIFAVCNEHLSINL